MTNAIIPTREQLQDFIYYRHKDAYGVKGRHYDFDAMSYEQLEKEAIWIDNAANEQIAHERRCEAKALIEFRANIRKVREICNCNRDTAIRVILDGEGHQGEYDPGYVCYSMGLPYSMAKYIEPRLKVLNMEYAIMQEESMEKYDYLEAV